jgi:hypothetical protein
MKKEPDYTIDPVSATTRSHFAAWILAISSLFASSKPTQTKVCSSFSTSLSFGRRLLEASDVRLSRLPNDLRLCQRSLGDSSV